MAKEAIKIARKYGKIVTVDPKPSNIMNYVKASSMTPNKKEALECAKLPKGTDIDVVGTTIREKLQLDNLLLTRSEEGVSLYTENGVANIPTFAKEVYDVTGAGDTVISVSYSCKSSWSKLDRSSKNSKYSSRSCSWKNRNINSNKRRNSRFL